jgi:hypothetical protein
MSVTSRPLTPPAKPRQPKIGFLSPRGIERAFTWFLYLVMLALVLLSVVGTFYGLNGLPAPITAPAQLVADVQAQPGRLGIAIAVQVVLTLVQYGARQMAKYDPRWWLLYLVSLCVSGYYNFQAYWEPVTAFAAPLVAAMLIIGGDVLPEFLAVRRAAPATPAPKE